MAYTSPPLMKIRFGSYAFKIVWLLSAFTLHPVFNSYKVTV